MQNSKAAKRYARALFQVGLEANLLKVFNEDMQKLKNLIQDSTELQSLFKSPIIKPKKKIAILKEIFSGKIHQTIINFLNIITNAKRENLTQSICIQFNKMYLDYMGIKTAEVTSVSKLDEKTRVELSEKLESFTNAKVNLKESIDESLIGGITLSIEDKQFDNSIKTQLNKMRKELTE